MKNKVLIGLIATATIGSAIATPSIINTHEKAHIVNTNKEKTNETVVINGNSNTNQLKIN